MNITRWLVATLIVFVGASLMGCATHHRRHHHEAEATSQPSATMQEMARQRVRDLRAAVAHFQEQANALPGADEQEHRQIMENAFDDLNIALPILVGPQPSFAFKLQMKSVRGARNELAENPNVAPESIVDSGLRSAVSAMGRIAHEDFYGGSTHAVDQLRVALRPLDRTSGPMHRLAVRDVVRQMADELRKLADTYADKIGEQERTGEAAAWRGQD